VEEMGGSWSETGQAKEQAPTGRKLKKQKDWSVAQVALSSALSPILPKNEQKIPQALGM
jgi:hypothetical protein